jgi:predicted ribosome quality control (RQC) complex YloA/Tae2 family protein
MIADTRRNENPTQVTANQDLKQSLKAVQAQAEALISNMDILIRQISFDEGEFKKWDNLREALADFQTLEVNPGVPVMVMIPPERLTKLNMAYGPRVGDAINKMIDELTATDETKQKEPQQKSRFKQALDQIQPKVQPLEQ